jgi:o-succinylbenzoate synthase
MKFLSFSLESISTPFKRPLHIGKKQLFSKPSLYLTLNFSNGFSGTGEISLLPGLIDHSPSEIKRELEYFLTPLEGTSLLITKDILTKLPLEHPFFGLLPRPSSKLCSPTIFGLEMAILLWMEKSFPLLFSKTLNKDIDQLSVPVNELIFPLMNPEDLFQQQGKTFKIKIGRGAEKEEITFLNKLGATLSIKGKKDLSLRLDGNQNFSLEGLLSYLKKLTPQTKGLIEYIEEPLLDLSLWPEIYEQTGLGLGIDESLLDFWHSSKKFPKGTKALIVKPSFHGGASQTFSFIRWAKKNNLKCVISSTFETSLGLYALALLANYQGNCPAGLSTSSYLVEKSPLFNLSLQKGRLSFIKDESPS